MKKSLLFILTVFFLCTCYAQEFPDYSFSYDFMTGSGNNEELPDDDSANDMMDEAIPLETPEIALVVAGVLLIVVGSVRYYRKQRG